MGETKRYSINGCGCFSAREVSEKTGISYSKVQQIKGNGEEINGFSIKLIQRRLYFAYMDGEEVAGGYRTAENMARAIGYSVNGMNYQRKTAKKPRVIIERRWVNV